MYCGGYAYELPLTVVTWCDNPSPASVDHPDIPLYRTCHQFIPVRTSESSHKNLKIMPRDNNESL